MNCRSNWASWCHHPDGEEVLARGCALRSTVSSQRWKTFVHNHASASVACDFATVVTATFRRLYVLVVMEIGTRKILHCNVTTHPLAELAIQQFREAIPSDHSYRFLIHDRDSIFSVEVDQTIENLGLKVLRTPVRAPQANALL